MMCGSADHVSLTWMLGKITEQVLLEHIFGHMKYKKVMRNSQCEFTMGVSCLNL